MKWKCIKCNEEMYAGGGIVCKPGERYYNHQLFKCDNCKVAIIQLPPKDAANCFEENSNSAAVETGKVSLPEYREYNSKSMPLRVDTCVDCKHGPKICYRKGCGCYESK